MSECVGHELGLDRVPAGSCGMAVIVMVVQRSVCRRMVVAQALDNAAQSLGRANERVCRGSMADLFAPDGILLVTEFERRVLDSADAVRVIQRCFQGVVDSATYRQVDLAQGEGLGARVFVGSEGVFGWSEQPEEGDHNEVTDVFVEGTVLEVVEIEGGEQGPDDGDVDRVGSAWRVIVVLEGLEES